MKRHIVLAVPIALLIFIAVITSVMKRENRSLAYVARQELDIICNNAADAAVSAYYDTTDLNMDYTNYENVQVDPELILDEYIQTFLTSYGMAITEENKALIKNQCIQVFCVASYDGYYIADKKQINSNGANDLLFSLKQPYLYKKDNQVFALNMGYATSLCYTVDGISRVKAPIDETEQHELICNQVSDALIQALCRSKDGYTNKLIYIPTKVTNLTRANTINGVTVFIYMDNLEDVIGADLDIFAIGGSRINRIQYVACYESDGKLVYSYVEDIPKSVDVIEVLDSPEAAAVKGYERDLNYLR